jgi:hypothetical protein
MSTVANIIVRGACGTNAVLMWPNSIHNYLISQTFDRHFRTVHRTPCLVCLIQNTDPLWFMTLWRNLIWRSTPTFKNQFVSCWKTQTHFWKYFKQNHSLYYIILCPLQSAKTMGTMNFLGGYKAWTSSSDLKCLKLCKKVSFQTDFTNWK